jgi:hypothetical protein
LPSQARGQSALARRRLLPIGLLALVFSVPARGKPGIGLHVAYRHGITGA